MDITMPQMPMPYTYMYSYIFMRRTQGIEKKLVKLDNWVGVQTILLGSNP
jgi:hypothetical protein